VNAEDESKLDVQVVAEEGKEFTNTFHAGGQAKPSGFKELTNRLPELGEFKFDIKEGNTVITTVESTDDLNSEQNKKKINYPTFKYTVDAAVEAGTTYDKDSNTITVNVQDVKDIASPYTYTVKEVVPEGATETSDGKYIYKGVTYDLTEITLTVTVEQDLDDKSRLIVTINKSTGNDFKNEYETVGGLELTAEKTLLGRILNSGDFEFELKDDKGNVLQTKANVGNTITFDPIKYTQDDMDRDDHGFIIDTVKNYSVNEVIPAGATQTSDGRYVYNGVTYSTKEYKIKVSLKDDKEGNIIVTVEDEFDNIIEAILAKYKFVNAFENFYDAVGEGTFEGHKTLRGREITEDDEETVFTFKIEIDGKEFTLTNTGTQIQYPKLKFVVDSSLDPGTVIKPAWEDDSHKAIVIRAADLENIIEVVDANADPVEYKEKAYEYKVTEEAGSAAGITYDTKEYTVTAIVNLNASDNGKLDVEVKTDPEGDVDFVNTYRARGEGTNEGTKFLYGRIIAGNEFKFDITDEKGTVIGTVGNDASGVVQYPIFKYVVDPDADNLGLTTEEDANGNLTTIIKTYDSKEALEKDATATYKVKEVEGTEPGITYDGKTVDTIKVSVVVTKEEIEEGVAKLDVTVDRDPDAEFTNYYKAMGEKQISGYKHLTYRLPEDEEFEFVIYEVKQEPAKANTEICRVKSTTMLNADEDAVAINYPTFRYIVDYTAEPGTVYDRDNNVIIVTVNWFEELAGGFEYLITEVDDGKDYFTYDTTEISLYVNVTATGEEIEPHVEKLNVAIEDSEGNDYYNEYHAEGALQLYAKKTLLGRILNRKDFTFTLQQTDETFETAIGEPDTKTNMEDGSITFDLIQYDLDSMDADEHGFVVDTNYYYTVSEVVPAGAVENEDGTYTYNGVTYDPTVFHITAKLHDNKHGLIEVTVEAVPDGELTFLEELKLYEFTFGNAFENFYHAEGENTISGTKMLRGRKLKEGEYQFTIKDEEGNVLATVSNKEDGTINYPVFRYVVNHLADGTSYSYDETNNTLTLTTDNLEDMVTPVMVAGLTEPTDDGEPQESYEKVGYEPKDYIYTVDEVIPEGAVDNGDGTYTYKGVTYNELGVHYTLTVTVEVNAEDMGILDVTIDNPEGLDFSNAYRASGEDTFTGKKILKNDDIKNYEGVFKFTVSDSEGNVITTVSSDKDANILYPTFRYVVDPDAEAGAVYDEAENVYTVTVNAYEDLAEVYKYNVTEVEPTTEEKEKNEALYNMLFNTGDFTEYEISITVVANEEDASILDVVALPDKEVDFVNTFYHKAGLYKVSEKSGEALKGAVIRLVRVDDNTIVDEWTSDGTVHMINLIDLGEGTFRFVEVKSPSGYHLAKSIEFTQDKDGVLTSPYDHIYDKDGNAIFVMYDPSDSKTGDNAPIAAAGGAFAVGLAGLAAVLASKKKRRI
jgi:pilin isopeptide linkage protein